MNPNDLIISAGGVIYMLKRVRLWAALRDLKRILVISKEKEGKLTVRVLSDKRDLSQ